jgi:hypothetical protein
MPEIMSRGAPELFLQQLGGKSLFDLNSVVGATSKPNQIKKENSIITRQNMINKNFY